MALKKRKAGAAGLAGDEKQDDPAAAAAAPRAIKRFKSSKNLPFKKRHSRLRHSVMHFSPISSSVEEDANNDVGNSSSSPAVALRSTDASQSHSVVVGRTNDAHSNPVLCPPPPEPHHPVQPSGNRPRAIPSSTENTNDGSSAFTATALKSNSSKRVTSIAACDHPAPGVHKQTELIEIHRTASSKKEVGDDSTNPSHLQATFNQPAGTSIVEDSHRISPTNSCPTEEGSDHENSSPPEEKGVQSDQAPGQVALPKAEKRPKTSPLPKTPPTTTEQPAPSTIIGHVPDRHEQEQPTTRLRFQDLEQQHEEKVIAKLQELHRLQQENRHERHIYCHNRFWNLQVALSKKDRVIETLRAETIRQKDLLSQHYRQQQQQQQREQHEADLAAANPSGGKLTVHLRKNRIAPTERRYKESLQKQQAEVDHLRKANSALQAAKSKSSLLEKRYTDILEKKYQAALLVERRRVEDLEDKLELLREAHEKKQNVHQVSLAKRQTEIDRLQKDNSALQSMSESGLLEKKYQEILERKHQATLVVERRKLNDLHRHCRNLENQLQKLQSGGGGVTTTKQQGRGRRVVTQPKSVGGPATQGMTSSVDPASHVDPVSWTNHQSNRDWLQQLDSRIATGQQGVFGNAG